MSTPFDPNRTQVGIPGDPVVDPNRTQAYQPADAAALGRTTAMAPVAALSLAVHASREATVANGPAREQFLIEVRGGGATVGLPGVPAASPRTPLNLCLVIDRSGSMEGVPLDFVKQACSYVVDLLTPNDVLSIVTFEDSADVLMPPQRVTSKHPIKEGIQRLQAGNTTNLHDGMSLGAQLLASAYEPGRATRMVVLTDGEPTAGIKEFAALVAHAGSIRERGISCTLLGFGAEYNEELLATMAMRSGGNYYYIPQPQLIPEVFRAELEKLMTVVATNLRLKVKLARWVSLLSATGMSVPSTEREFVLDLADLERDQVIHQMLDLEFDNHPLGWYRVAGCTLEYVSAMTGAKMSEAIDLVMEFTSDSAKYSAPPNPMVSQAAQVAAASRVVEKTIMGLKTGVLSHKAAVEDLMRTQALLVQQNRTQEAQEVTMALRALQAGDAGGAEKTLMGTVVHLDQGKSKS